MINAGIIGATGYAGEELIDILLRHPDVRIKSVSAKIDKPQDISRIFPRFKGRISLICAEPQIKEIVSKCDLVFLALPHTVSIKIAPKLLRAGRKVIDLSADYRLRNIKTYTKFYKAAHTDKKNLGSSIYGLPELYRAAIKGARLIANPGCYPTAAILGLAPLVAFDMIANDSIIIDAKSGVTGAGKKASESLLFSEINEDFKAYKICAHQHTPEIDQELSKLSGRKLGVTFVPHLLPLNRGILETIYVRKIKGKKRSLTELYKRFYKKEPFVRVLDDGAFPKIKDVAHTNFCDIGIKDNGDTAVIIAAIDNLLKGASGQAVQNMNIMYKFPEHTALI
ncbi:MAG: N-acetyl-gamma-glutamyl-phosphate reductase [Candidatus Omnitrophota bacterium]|jgi:N-acetyl-gamma-glutamyl-phosphate reductase